MKTRKKGGRGKREEGMAGGPVAAPSLPSPLSSLRGSSLERRFAAMWRRLGGAELERELAFHPVRKWRFDFASRRARVGIECQGGTRCRRKSGHRTGAGIERDCEKLNAAQLEGWTVFCFTTTMVTERRLRPVIAYVKELL